MVFRPAARGPSRRVRRPTPRTRQPTTARHVSTPPRPSACGAPRLPPSAPASARAGERSRWSPPKLSTPPRMSGVFCPLIPDPPPPPPRIAPGPPPPSPSRALIAPSLRRHRRSRAWMRWRPRARRTRVAGHATGLPHPRRRSCSATRIPPGAWPRRARSLRGPTRRSWMHRRRRPTRVPRRPGRRARPRAHRGPRRWPRAHQPPMWSSSRACFGRLSCDTSASPRVRLRRQPRLLGRRVD